MDCHKRAQYFFLHCMSQILYTYLPGREEDPPNVNFPYFLEDWSIQHWKEYISFSLHHEKEIKEKCALRNLNINFLAQTIYDQLEFKKRHEIHLLFHGSLEYPLFLSHIADPPLCLFATGDLSLLKQPCVSVIGSRKANQKAIKEAYQMGLQLAQAGFTVVSGGAFGCDIAAHEGTLASHENSCPTVVVLPSGLSCFTPYGNRAIFSDISKNNGIFISERFFNQSPRPIDYPVRNRIISGMSLWTVVAQASQRSGAMVTARFALDHGRDVFVLEHDHDDVTADGSAQLLDEGAIKIFDSHELLRFLIDEKHRYNNGTMDLISDRTVF